jgi:proline dehydrogenase
MGATRALLLAASQNRWLRERASRYKFVKRSVSRFMPGETLDDAIAAARDLKRKNVAAVLTHLGENIFDKQEAENIATHYGQVLERIRAENLDAEISVKLTQLGLDLSPELCEQSLRRLLSVENPLRTVWIDMEASSYVEATLGIYKRLLADYRNVGICLQAYLHRTAADIDALREMKPTIRLVKGAYAEPPDVAIRSKAAINANYLLLAQNLLRDQVRGHVRRAAFATHDPALMHRITDFAAANGFSRGEVEVQMLYGIQRGEQERLAAGGWRSGVLVAYGDYWYPWFVRRLAERPANLWLLVRNLASD